MAQMLMIIEKMAELTKEISKADRKGIISRHNELVEEFVDVEIMIEQLEVMLSDHLHSFERIRTDKRHEKLTRLRDRLEA